MFRPYVAAPVGSIAAVTLALVLVLTAASAAERALICVLVPHFKDEYWLSTGYGLEQQAAKRGVDLLFFEAGGYGAREQQINQLTDCAATGSDAILIGAVTSDHPDLIDAIDHVSTRIPVFGLVNELHAATLGGQTGVDWADMGFAVGHYIAGLHPAGSRPVTALLISGPAESGWAGPLENGLRRGLRASAVELVGVFGADTGLQQQLQQVEIALSQHPLVDYFIGSAVATEAMIGLLSTREISHHPQLLSTYVNHSVKRGLMNGNILAAPFDDPTLQGIMAIDQAVSFLTTGQNQRLVGPDIVLLTSKDTGLAGIRVAPAGYFPDIR